MAGREDRSENGHGELKGLPLLLTLPDRSVGAGPAPAYLIRAKKNASQDGLDCATLAEVR